MTLAQQIDNCTLLIVSGSGGVGKTSSAAAIAATVATRQAKRVLVMTIDPAKRLADALGLEAVGNAPRVVELPQGAKGSLDAVMLDAKRSWDDLVNRHAKDEATKQKILANPLYRNITERFVQSHDYIAMERVHELHDSGNYDLIVIDTPPVAHAVDFLDAPDRMADFFDSRLLKFLVAPARSSIMSLTTRPFLQLADKLLGKKFLADISEFFTLLESMRGGFIERAKSVKKLIASTECAFVVVTTSQSAPLTEAKTFMSELDKRHLRLAGMVLNRMLPGSLLGDDAQLAADSLRSNKTELSQSLAARLEGADSVTVERVLNELVENFERFRQMALHERHQQSLIRESVALAKVPWFEKELTDLSGLLELGERILP